MAKKRKRKAAKSKCCKSINCKVGLALGLLFALGHAIWALLVAIIPKGMQKFCDWILGISMVKMTFTIQPFALTNAILLVIVTFVCGYVFGWVFSAILSWSMKK